MKKLLKRVLPLVLVVATVLSLTVVVSAAEEKKAQNNALVEASAALLGGKLEGASLEEVAKFAGQTGLQVGSALLKGEKILPTYMKIKCAEDETVKSVSIMTKTLTTLEPATINCLPNTYKVEDGYVLIYNYSLEDCTVIITYESGKVETHKMTLPELALDLNTIGVVLALASKDLGSYSIFEDNTKTNALIDTLISVAPAAGAVAVSLVAGAITEKSSSNSFGNIITDLGSSDYSSLINLIK